MAFLSRHISRLGSIFDQIPRVQSEKLLEGFSRDDEISLLMMLAERKSAPAHTLSLSMVLELLSGERGLEDFGLDNEVRSLSKHYCLFYLMSLWFDSQTNSDFCDRIASGNSSAVQRFAEGPQGPELLQV